MAWDVLRKRWSTIASLQDYITFIYPRLILHSNLFSPYVLRADPWVHSKTRHKVARESPRYNREASTDPSHAWACLGPGAHFMCWLRTERKQRRGAGMGALPKGRRVLWSWQDAASSFLSVSQVAADGTIGGRWTKRRPPCSCLCGEGRNFTDNMARQRKHQRAAIFFGTESVHFLATCKQKLTQARWSYGHEAASCFSQCAVLSNAGPLGASLCHVISENMTCSNVFVCTAAADFHLQVVLAV